MVKNPPANAGDVGSVPWDRKISWRRKWQPTPVFLPGKSHGQRSLAGYSPQGHKESDMTEHACTTTNMFCTSFLSPHRELYDSFYCPAAFHFIDIS